MTDCPHMSGDATCSICARLQQLERENEIMWRRLKQIADGEAFQPRQHAAAAFVEMKEVRKRE